MIFIYVNGPDIKVLSMYAFILNVTTGSLFCSVSSSLDASSKRHQNYGKSVK